jgi:hypothetical protein
MPKVRGPALSVVFASSGSRMLKLKPTAEKTTIIERVTSTVRFRRAYANPSRVPLQRVGRRRSSSGKSSDTRIASRPPSTATKLSVLTAKHQPDPNAAIRMPASAGPKMRAVLNRLELSAIAFGSSSRPTI